MTVLTRQLSGPHVTKYHHAGARADHSVLTGRFT